MFDAILVSLRSGGSGGTSTAVNGTFSLLNATKKLDIHW